MLRNLKSFKDNSKKLLSSTAIALIMSVMSTNAKAATELDDSTSYGPTDDLNGFVESSYNESVDVTFTTSEGEYFNIGADGTTSLLLSNEDSSTLNVAINNGGGDLSTSGIIFEDNITADSGGTINLNVNDGNVTFRGSVGGSGVVGIIAGNSSSGTTTELNFQNHNVETIDIYSTIRADDTVSGNTLNVNAVNNSGSSSPYIIFYENIGYNLGNADAYVDTFTIGDDGESKTNNVVFGGQYLNANSINIGVAGDSSQTHEIWFTDSLSEVNGNITGLAADTITMIKENDTNVEFNGSVSNIDEIVIDGSGATLFRGDVTSSAFTISSDEAILGFGSDNGDEVVTEVDSNITIDSGITSTILIGDEDNLLSSEAVNFSGAITASSGSTVNIEVSGASIIGYDDGGDITLADGNDTITSHYANNQFLSDVDFGDGDDTFTVSWDSITSLTGAMTNLENVNIEVEGVLVVHGGGSYTGDVDGDSDGSLVIGGLDGYYDLDETARTYNAPGTVDSVDLYVNGASTFNTNGHEFGSTTGLGYLELNNTATFNIQDDVTVAGNTTINNSGTIRIGAGDRLTTYGFESSGGKLIFDVASSSSAGFLEVTEQALDLEGVTVEANFTGADSLFTDGNQVKVAQGSGTLIGTDGDSGQVSTTITENSALFSVRMMDGSQLSTPGSDSDLYLVFSRDSTIREIAIKNNNKNVGDVFDNLTGTSNSQLSQIITNINAASQSELESILESTTPDVGGGIAVGSQNFVNNTLDITSDQITLAMNAHSGISAGDDMTGLRMWGQYFFDDSKQGTRQNIAGFSSSTNGFALGMDTADLIEGSVVGIGFSYGDTNVKSNNENSSKNRIDSYQLTLYGSHNLPADYFVKAMLAYSYNDVTTIRHNVGNLGLNAQGKYNANIYTARSDIGKDIKYGAMRVTPSLVTHYSFYNAENYTETGAGGANLNVNTKSMEIFELGSNLELGWDLKLGKEKVLSPELRVGYRYNFIGDRYRSTSSFTGGGTSFDTIGAHPAKGAVTLGGGAVYQVNDQWHLSLNYQYEYRQNFNSNSGFARLSYKF